MDVLEAALSATLSGEEGEGSVFGVGVARLSGVLWQNLPQQGEVAHGDDG